MGVTFMILTTLRLPLVSRRANRNSPARLGSMLSCRRRASLPAPGRQSGRIPEWQTETRTDIRTVLQLASVGPPCIAWDGTGTGAGVQPPELSAMSPTTVLGTAVLISKAQLYAEFLVYIVYLCMKKWRFIVGRLSLSSSERSIIANVTWAARKKIKTGSSQVRLLFTSD